MIEPVRMLEAAAFTALYPVMAQGALLRAAADHRSVRGYFRRLLAAAGAAALLLFIGAPALVRLLYGSEYAASAGVVRILAWTLIPFTASTFFTLRLLASRREPSAGWALAFAVLGLLLLGGWQIPVAGAYGAAWAVLAAECVQCILLLVSLRSNLSMQGQVRELPQSS